MVVTSKVIAIAKRDVLQNDPTIWVNTRIADPQVTLLDAIPLAQIDAILIWDGKRCKFNPPDMYSKSLETLPTRQGSTFIVNTIDIPNTHEGNSCPLSQLKSEDDREPNSFSSLLKMSLLTFKAIKFAIMPRNKASRAPPKEAAPVGAVRFRNTIEIRTRIDGHNSGRVYHLKAESEDECLRAGLRLSELRQRGAAADGGWYPPGGDPGQLQGRLPVPTRAGLHSASHCCGEEQPSIPLLL